MTIEGDNFALGRVFRNPITNGIQATQPGGQILVTTARAGTFAEITIADTGSGIPPDDWQRFSRISSRPNAAALVSRSIVSVKWNSASVTGSWTPRTR